MASSPERCPTCATEVPDGATRCPGCGRVFGEDNRCPHCHAIAAVIMRGGKTICAACGKPRAGATILGDGNPRGGSGATVSRARGRAQRAFGVLALGGGIFAAVLAAMVIPGAAGIGLAVLGGALGVGIGALSIRSGAQSMEKARAEEERANRAAVLELAEELDGRVTATQAAQALRLSIEEADAVLTAMVGDGSRVDVDVDREGVVIFVFRELARAARVRVEPLEEDDTQEEVEASTESERKREREA